MAKTKWQRIEWAGGNMAGPATAIAAVAEWLADTEYTITDIKGPKAPARTTTKKVGGVSLEVRDTDTPTPDA